MKKILLFALAISLGSIAFAAWPPDPLPQSTCDFFGYPSWHNRSVKGCLTCPVRDGNGNYVTCESVSAANGGQINRDCCWLNTPKDQNLDPILGNCYTNGCVLGPNPWSVKCVCKLNCAMSDPTEACYNVCNTYLHPNDPNVPSDLHCIQYNQSSGVVAPNGGNGGTNGSNNGNSSFKVKTKIHGTTGQGPAGSVVKPTKPVSAKQTSVQKKLQTSSKKTTK